MKGGDNMPITAVDGCKKDGLQKYRVRINFTDDYGKRRQVERTAYGMKQAKEIESQLMKSVEEETPARKMSVEQLYQEYIRAKTHEVRASTLDKSKTTLKLHIIPILGEYKIDKLTVPVLEEWKRQIEDKGLSIRMRKNIYGEFRAMLNYAVKLEYLPNNPLLKVGNFRAPLELKKEMQYYTAEEFKKFISEARKLAEESEKSGSLYEWNYFVFFCIAFFMGMRKGEIYALQWTDIKNGNLMSITKSLNQKMDNNNLVTPPKNASSIRTIEIPEPLQEVLTEHKERCRQIDGFSEGLYICGGKQPVRDSTVQKYNKRFAEQAGIKQIRLHDFRHSHASLLANEGINIQEVARRLGHSDIEITLKTYAHLYPRESERAVSVLNSVQL